MVTFIRLFPPGTLTFSPAGAFVKFKTALFAPPVTWIRSAKKSMISSASVVVSLTSPGVVMLMSWLLSQLSSLISAEESSRSDVSTPRFPMVSFTVTMIFAAPLKNVLAAWMIPLTVIFPFSAAWMLTSSPAVSVPVTAMLPLSVTEMLPVTFPERSFTFVVRSAFSAVI